MNRVRWLSFTEKWLYSGKCHLMPNTLESATWHEQKAFRRNKSTSGTTVQTLGLVFPWKGGWSWHSASQVQLKIRSKENNLLVVFWWWDGLPGDGMGWSSWGWDGMVLLGMGWDGPSGDGMASCNLQKIKKLCGYPQLWDVDFLI